MALAKAPANFRRMLTAEHPQTEKKVREDIMKIRPPCSIRPASRFTALAASLLVGLALSGCNKADESANAPPAAATPSTSSTPPSTPSASTPSGSTPSGATTPAPAPSSSATTPGTPQGAANTLPPTSDIGKADEAKASQQTSGAKETGTAKENGSAREASGSAKPPENAADAKETNPTGDLTKKEEKEGMPEALHGNNHSSPALDGDGKKQ